MIKNLPHHDKFSRYFFKQIPNSKHQFSKQNPLPLPLFGILVIEIWFLFEICVLLFGA